MSVKRDVFASKSERRNFYKLRRTWGDKYALWHNLPFLSIFGTEDLLTVWDYPDVHPIRLTDLEVNRLKKTSVDFTLCDLQDSPIICIEFDGMQDGFNVGATYYPNQILPGGSGIWRRQITELKLKVALGSRFPFIVVGSKQFEEIHPDAKLTIVDAIIGDVLSSQATSSRLAKGPQTDELVLSDDELKAMSQSDVNEMLQDWALGIEVENDMEYNPVARKRAQLETALSTRGYKLEFLSYPNIDEAPTLGDRIKAFDGALLLGTRITYHTDDLGEVDATAWLPNFKIVGYAPVSLSEEIAGLLALERVKRLRSTEAGGARSLR